jgi:hypothetical protein
VHKFEKAGNWKTGPRSLGPRTHEGWKEGEGWGDLEEKGEMRQDERNEKTKI